MRNLFRPPAEALIHDMETAMKAIIETTRLSGTHAKELPFAVRDLSRLLTQDRALLSSSYWINKRLLTAYCRYFLPWNLVRLSWMLPGLDLPLAEGDTVLDLGSGPLTVPLALWLARPELRAKPLTLVCCDVAPGPLSLGRDIFHRLAPDSPWKIETVRMPLEKALREFSGKANLITAANVLNEFKPSRETPLPARLAAFTRLVASRLAPGGRFFAVEPGTRLGGKLMAVTRQVAFGSRLVPEAPCPHWGPCPMLAERASGWCHFSHIAAAAPKELTLLTKRAGLEKDTLSLSCMLLRRATDEEISRAEACLPVLADDDFLDDDLFDEDEADDGDFDAWAEAFAASRPTGQGGAPDFGRIISDPIRLPDAAEAARYACSVNGLLLAQNALRVPSGAAFAVPWPEREMRDGKSGALIVSLPLQKSRGERETGPDRKPGRPQRGEPTPQNAPQRRDDRREPSPHGERKTPRGGSWERSQNDGRADGRNEGRNGGRNNERRPGPADGRGKAQRGGRDVSPDDMRGARRDSEHSTGKNTGRGATRSDAHNHAHNDGRDPRHDGQAERGKRSGQPGRDKTPTPARPSRSRSGDADRSGRNPGDKPDKKPSGKSGGKPGNTPENNSGSKQRVRRDKNSSSSGKKGDRHER